MTRVVIQRSNSQSHASQNKGGRVISERNQSPSQPASVNCQPETTAESSHGKTSSENQSCKDGENARIPPLSPGPRLENASSSINFADLTVSEFPESSPGKATETSYTSEKKDSANKMEIRASLLKDEKCLSLTKLEEHQQNKKQDFPEPCLENSNPKLSTTLNPVRPRRRNSTSSKVSPPDSKSTSPRSKTDIDGYNSGDEYPKRGQGCSHDDEREAKFEADIRMSANLVVKKVLDDGNCLFRAVADQVYGDPDMCYEVRQLSVDYLEKESDHFSQFVTECFSEYCRRKRRDKVHGNNLELQAMAEMYSRPIHIYSYSSEPINIFHGSYQTDLPPIRLSYHRGNHYNSLVDPTKPVVGAGLGFGNFRGGVASRDQVKATLKAQQDQQIERALLSQGILSSELDFAEGQIQNHAVQLSLSDYSFSRERQPVKNRHVVGNGRQGSSASTIGSRHEPSATGGPFEHADGNPSVTPTARLLMSMGFGYVHVMEALNIFGDDFDNLLCYLVESGGSSDRGFDESGRSHF